MNARMKAALESTEPMEQRLFQQSLPTESTQPWIKYGSLLLVSLLGGYILLKVIRKYRKPILSPTSDKFAEYLMTARTPMDSIIDMAAEITGKQL
jgi:ABC-type nickel/cobalt efflux system permease component RcnA